MNPIKHSCIFTALMCFLFTGASSQQSKFDWTNDLSNIKINNWTTDDGLPSNSLLTLHQDQRGYLWASTYNGLVRFDGVNFVTYNKSNTPSFKSNQVNVILGDESDNIWIGTGKGLIRYTNGSFTNLAIEDYDVAIQTLEIDESNHNLWIGTREHGIFIYDTETNQYQKFNNPIPQKMFVRSILLDDDGGLWLAADQNGLFHYSKGKWTLYSKESGILDNQVYSVFRDYSGVLYVGTASGLYVKDKNKFKIVSKFNGKRINLIDQDEQNNLWVQTSVGIYKQNNIDNSWSYIGVEEGLPSGDSFDVLFGLEGSVWLASYHEGLIQISENKFKNYTLSNELSSRDVSVIEETSPSSYLVGTNNGKIYEVSDGIIKASPIKTNFNDRIYDIFKDQDENIWIATYYGLLLRTRLGDEFFFNQENGLPINLIRFIHQDRMGNYWLGTRSGGLIKMHLDPSTHNPTFSKFSRDDELNPNYITSIDEDEKGNIIVGGSNEGFNIISKYSHQYFGKKDGLICDFVFNIHIDSGGSYWLATDVGLVNFTKGSFFAYTYQDGIPSETIFDVIEDSLGNLWFPSNSGIIKASKEQLLSYRDGNTDHIKWELFTINDGMNRSQCTGATHSLLASDGKIWIPTAGGVVVVDPQNVNSNNRKPNIHINKLIVNEQVIDQFEPIILPPGKHRLEFNYTDVSLSYPGTSKYKYRLTNYDNEWINAGKEQQAVYTNLTYGTYQFEVIAASSNGVWNEKASIVSIEVLPHYYQTVWFYLLLSAVFGTLVYGYTRWRTHSIRKQALILRNLIEVRTKEVSAQKKELQVQAERLKEANIEISMQKDSYRADYESVKMLSEIGSKIISTLSIESISGRAYDSMNRLMSADMFNFGLYNDTKKTLDFSGNIEKGKTHANYSYHLDKDSERLNVICFKNQEVIITNDFEKDYPSYPKSIVGKLPKSSLKVPLFQKDKVIGVVSVSSYKKNAYSDYHISILQNLAVYISIAIQNATSFKKLEEAYNNITLLNNIGQDISANLSIENIVQSVFKNIQTLMEADKFGIGIIDDLEDTLIFNDYSADSEKFSVIEFPLSDPNWLSVSCVTNKIEIVSGNIKEEYPQYISSFINYENSDLHNSIIILPLIVNDEVIGNIGVQSKHKSAYTGRHVELLRSLSIDVGIAVQNASTFDKLNYAFKELKELDEYKEAMTAMIVHDFKNSLNTVISFSEGTPTERRLKSIRQAGQFMLNMVLNILDVQKFESTEIKLALNNKPIRKVIDEAVNQLGYMMEQKSIKLKYKPNNELVANYDYELTTRVIVNILSNAIKYVPTNGTIEITIEAENGFVKTSIRDNGLGIPADKLDMVFDKYSQINAKASGSVRSTGIGLTFCKMVVEAQGGTIGVTSEEGKGSNFYFTLPLSEITKEPKPTLEKANIELKKEKSIKFSEKDKEVLAPILEELNQWEVYDYSEVSAILEKVNTSTENINLWKEQIIKALHNVNEEQYNELAKIETQYKVEE